MAAVSPLRRLGFTRLASNFLTRPQTALEVDRCTHLQTCCRFGFKLESIYNRWNRTMKRATSISDSARPLDSPGKWKRANLLGRELTGSQPEGHSRVTTISL